MIRHSVIWLCLGLWITTPFVFGKDAQLPKNGDHKTVWLLKIQGPSEMKEQSRDAFIATATYDDLTTAEVNPTWSVLGGGFAIAKSNGTVIAGEVQSHQVVTLKASFNGKSATKNIWIKNLNKTVIALAIQGETWVAEQSSTTYSATANYEDGTSATVRPSWSVDGSGLATITAEGLFSAGPVSANNSVTITIGYEGKSATKTVTIRDIP